MPGHRRDPAPVPARPARSGSHRWVTPTANTLTIYLIAKSAATVKVAWIVIG